MCSFLFLQLYKALDFLLYIVHILYCKTIPCLLLADIFYCDLPIIRLSKRRSALTFHFVALYIYETIEQDSSSHRLLEHKCCFK